MPRKQKFTSETEQYTLPRKLRVLIQGKNAAGEAVSRKALADYLGVSPQSIGYYLTGQSEPTLPAIVRIAEYFGVSTDFLLTETPVKTSNPSVQAAIKLTGLSEKAIGNLTAMQEKRLAGINMLLEEECTSNLPEDLDGGLLNKIVRYLHRKPTSQTVVIDNRGEVRIIPFDVFDKGQLEDQLKERLEAQRIEDKADFLAGIFRAVLGDTSGNALEVEAIIDRVQLDEITETLKQLRATVQEETSGEYH